MTLRGLVERDGRLDTPRVRIALLLLFVALTTVVSSHHEPDRDEADYWLVSRDTTVSELLRLMPYAGTPFLGYAFQRPFAKAGLPYQAQAVLHVALGAASAALLLEHAPFPLAVRAGLLLGPYFGVEYAVVRRSYALTVVLLLAALTLLAPRPGTRRPVRGAPVGVALLLLANTNVHGAALALAIGLGLLARDVVERTPRPLDWGLAGLGVALALWQIWPPLDGQIFDPTLTRGPRNLALAMREAFLPDLASPAAVAVSAALVLCAIVGLASRPGALVTAAGGFLGPALLITFVYSSGRRHYGFLLLGVLAGLWLGAREAETAAGFAPRLRIGAAAAAAALGVLSVVVGAAAGVRQRSLEIDYPSSGAGEMAAFIRAAHLGDRVFVGDRPYVAEGVLPYLPGLKMWYPLFRRFGTYMPWNTVYVRRLQGDRMLERVARRFPAWRSPSDGVCLLLSRPIPRPWRLGLRLAHRAPHRIPLGLPDEVLLLYVPIGPSPGRIPRLTPILLPGPPR